MKYKGIQLDGLDIEIDIEAAKSYIEFRVMAKKPLTQRAFDQAMKKALMAFTINMTPTDVIDYTVEKGWQGINLEWITNAKQRETIQIPQFGQQNVVPIGQRSTRDISIHEQLNDTSWADI